MARDEQDPGALADEMEQDAERLENRSKELGADVDDVRKDWERKRSDQGVPGANPPEGDGDQAESDRGEETSGQRGEETSGQGSDVQTDREAGHD